MLQSHASGAMLILLEEFSFITVFFVLALVWACFCVAEQKLRRKEMLMRWKTVLGKLVKFKIRIPETQKQMARDNSPEIQREVNPKRRRVSAPRADLLKQLPR
jgi:hypothetical protein